MKRVVFCSLMVIFCTLGAFTATYAQHIISIQSAERRPFTIQVNGSKLNSSKTGSARIGNLSAGNYSLVIKPAGDAPAQSFTCVVDKSDLSYSFINDAQKGWILKDTKSNDEIMAVGQAKANAPPVSVPAAVAGKAPKTPAPAPQQGPLTSPFALMLAQVVHDPELLNSTPWVLTTKVDGSEDATNNDGSNNVFAEQVANDTAAYEAATKGVIKAAQKYVKGGTEITFVDFTAISGDTVHIMVPSTDTSAEGEDDEPAATAKTTPLAANTDSVKNSALPALTQDVPVEHGDTIRINPATAKKEDTQPAFDTSTNKQYVNPFFNKTADSTKEEVVKPAESQPGTGTPAAPPADDSKKGKKDDKKKEQDEVKSQPVTEAPAPANTGTPTNKALVNGNCGKPMSDKDQEKLKHKIYLETDQDKIIEMTKKAINGKCITTAQVKDLAGLFLTDDGRYHLFYTVYPNVYDVSSFSRLRTYMIDAKYKAMFDALVK